jgi:predicted amidohydrolase/ribosomal protein S18 acetylase RimI-like enzyme
MTDIDVSTFERRISLRNMSLEDYDAIVALQLECFPTMKPWTRPQIESQLLHFPEGQFVIEVDGEIIASSCSLIVDDAEYSAWDDWKAIADGGFIRNHDPEGDTLYGIEIQVSPRMRGMKLARRLYDARKELCREKNLARISIGGRIPGYAACREKMTAQEYVQRVLSKELYDPVLTTQISNGFVLEQLVPDYLPSDEDSAGFATQLEWANLEYRPPQSRRRRRAVEQVRLALVQYGMRPIANWAEFEKQCAFFVDVASDSKADFLLFPELFTVQLLSLVEAHRPGEAARALASYTPGYLELFRNLAIKYNVNIIGGSQFTVEEDGLYNIAYLFRRDGTIDKSYKIHITPSEAKWWGVKGGDKVRVYDTDRGKIAIIVCYDIEFPELARLVTEAGARIIFVPFNTNDRYGHLRVRLCAQARCIENQVYVVTSGCVGNLPFVENADVHYAQSGIFTPSDIPFARDGIAAEASANIETMIVHDLDLEVLRRARQTGTVRNWNDRRRDLYRVNFRTADGEFEV